MKQCQGLPSYPHFSPHEGPSKEGATPSCDIKEWERELERLRGRVIATVPGLGELVLRVQKRSSQIAAEVKETSFWTKDEKKEQRDRVVASLARGVVATIGDMCGCGDTEGADRGRLEVIIKLVQDEMARRAGRGGGSRRRSRDRDMPASQLLGAAYRGCIDRQEKLTILSGAIHSRLTHRAVSSWCDAIGRRPSRRLMTDARAHYMQSVAPLCSHHHHHLPWRRESMWLCQPSRVRG